ncbi:MAG: IclR family transcriptional regulator [Chloroflexota bacterium]
MSSLERALDLLTTLEKKGPSMGLSELSRAAGIHKATTQRLLCVLERRGFVQRVHGRYQIGVAAVPLAYAFLGENSLPTAARPILEQLTLISGETSSMFVRQGFDRVVIQRVNSPHPLRYSLQIGQRLPLHLGASGRVLAAAMPEEELLQLLDQLREARLVSGETLSREDLWARIDETRQIGFAVSMEERAEGVASVAAPIVVAGEGTIAAINIAGPVSRMVEERVPQLVGELRRSAEEIARAYARM